VGHTVRDACALTPGSGTNPFVSHAFLKALEQSRSVGTGTGWLSQHVLVRDAESGLLVGASPCYVKSHSAGEYVFDHSWASAYARAGGRYYPKLQCCVPFTPVTGV
jgi:predicted N-acyltransferase